MKKTILILTALFMLPICTPAATGTSACLDLPQSPVIGKTSAAGKSLQQFLYDGGYLKVAPTGFYGQSTTAAIRNFQIKNNIPVTGKVGSETRAKIKALTCSKTKTVVPMKSVEYSLSANVSGPGTIKTGKLGNWTITAKSEGNTGPLTYTANWGDGIITKQEGASAFTHAYAQVGTYKIIFKVMNKEKMEITLNLSVTVVENTPLMNVTTYVSPITTTTVNSDGDETEESILRPDYNEPERPVIISITPSPAVINQQVTVNGTGFSDVSQTYFDGVAYGSTMSDGTSLTFTIPSTYPAPSCSGNCPTYNRKVGPGQHNLKIISVSGQSSEPFYFDVVSK